MSNINCIQDFFENIVQKIPYNIAILTENEQLTYQELHQKSNQLAHYLKGLEIEKKEEILVGICLERNANLIISLLGILKAGFAYVPLDPNYPQDRLDFMIKDSQLSILITQESLSKNLPNHSAIKVNLDQEQDNINRYSTTNITHTDNINSLAYIIYTSGSTGQPKGVEIEHRNTIAFINWAIDFFSLEQLKGVLASTSICFDLSIFEIFVPLSVGGKVILVDNILHLPESSHAQEVTLIDTVPSAIASICKINGIPSSVTTVNLAGEALSNKIVQEVYKFKQIKQVFNLYGPSEDTTFSTVALIPKGYDDIPPIGKPISQTEVLLLDENLQVVPEGELGEIYLTGAGIARGYRNREDLTAERFLPNPFTNDSSSKMYKTGDIAVYLPDGQLRFVGRNDQLVKIRGFRVELGEIEATLEKYPSISKAVVILYNFNEEDKRLIAYLTLRNQGKKDNIISAIQDYLIHKLPPHEIPFSFIILSEFPQTLNGKIDRRALPIPQEETLRKTSYSPPTNSIEIKLTQMWQKSLNLHYIGVNDDFFDLGGDSLKAIVLMDEINTYFNCHISINKFLENSTITCLAENIKAKSYVNLSKDELEFMRKDVILKSDIFPENKFNFKENKDNVFLTGSTGLLGIHLLSQLLINTSYKIYCLVREKKNIDTLKRIEKRLKNNHLWEEKWHDRIIPVIGDLAEPNLGLSIEKFKELAQKIDLIYHCGAWVNIVYPYSFLRRVNVKGTEEIIKLACHFKTKPIFYISTTDVFSSEKITFIKTDQKPDGHFLCGGYAKSKYVAEKLLIMSQSRGVPITIFRPSNIINFTKPNSSFSAEFIPRMLKGCLQLSLFPDIDAIVNLVSVDYISKTIVYLSQQESSLNNSFNLVNPNPIKWSTLLHWMKKNNSNIEIISYQKWYEKLQEIIRSKVDNELTPFLTLLKSENFLQRSLGSFEFQEDKTLQNLFKIISCPCIEEKLLKAYFADYLTQPLIKNNGYRIH
ncbi:amino acid adenylation domain-containing protein [Geminocystis sp. NIES-3709]|uniref:non-ribosomal peptide synthetase n=1 Tax=Geminocystis sp. NIES-3709 TaxID=1617448 RepID=UPI0005FC3C62|nr:amino acid adenylation domain-containing protein [Geminocystis sp. NIES-3709]BAQ66126.1 malonyl CoA-acyl carrier protein transacylase [Geminocystis sp. NIES-3709]